MNVNSLNSSKNLQINKKMSMDSDPLVSWQVLFYVWHKNKYEKRIFHELSPGMVRGSCTWQVLFKTVLLQCVHITANYFPSHFIQAYINCDHYLFVIPDYRWDDAKGEIWRSWVNIFSLSTTIIIIIIIFFPIMWIRNTFFN